MATLTLTIDDDLVPRLTAMARGRYAEIIPAGSTDQQAIRRVIRHWLQQELVDYEGVVTQAQEETKVASAKTALQQAIAAARAAAANAAQGIT